MSEEIVKADEFQLTDPKMVLALATDLQEFVKKHSLTTNIQGKQYVNVEGWQYIGSRAGVYPLVVDVKAIPAQTGEWKYGCSVELRRIKNDQVVGRGYGVCSNKEPNKRSFQEYAVASMSQTRAVGKAFRLMFGFLMKASGFEATPSEEMSDIAKDEKKVENEFEGYLKRMAKAKEMVGDTIYYEVLGSNGYEHANEIKAFAEFKKLLTELNTAYKQKEAK